MSPSDGRGYKHKGPEFSCTLSDFQAHADELVFTRFESVLGFLILDHILTNWLYIGNLMLVWQFPTGVNQTNMKVYQSNALHSNELGLTFTNQ